MNQVCCVRGWMWGVLVALAVSLTSVTATAAPPPEKATAAQPPELGAIHWQRGFDGALAAAKKADRPLLVLFQEVPGCGTCVGYGAGPLSHPLIVEAAETLFRPVAVYNNIPGDDEKTLKSFKEKAWNNPVVRIVSADRRDIVPRVAGDYSSAGLVAAMVAALEKQKKPVPRYLRMLAEELRSRSRKTETATFAMHCFWEGEGALGRMPGVLRTLPGFVGKREVVEVEFDPSIVDYAALVEKARGAKCASRVFTRSDRQQKVARKLVGDEAERTDEATRPDKQPKYYLSRTPMRFVPMTPMQACRVNSAIGAGKDAKPLLSPRQAALFETVKVNLTAGWPDAVGAEDLAKAWGAAQTVAARLRRG